MDYQRLGRRCAMLTSDGTSRVDVLSLEDFRTTLEGRLSEAETLRICLVEQLRTTAPKLGELPDAEYVRRRYKALYDHYIERVTTLIDALIATRAALTT